MSPNITKDYFLALFSEFSKVQQATLDAYIGIASGRVPLNVWGTNTNYATALLTAHMLTVRGHAGMGVAGGALTQETVGDLSRSYETTGDQNSGDAELKTTRYGIDFVALRNETLTYMMTTGPRCKPSWGC